jgi:hypothetical protein
VGLHFLAEGSQLMTHNLFSLLKQHLRNLQHYSNEEMEMAVCDLKCKNPIYTMAEFLNFCQGGVEK